MVPQQTLSPRQQAWMRAREKAARLAITPASVFEEEHDVYAVRSSHGGLYFVKRNATSTVYTCECPAGQEGIPCYHAAAVAALPEEVARRAEYRASKAQA